jgi:AraC-like DNA-binding protein
MSFSGIYLYHRIIKAKIYIDTHYAENINLDLIANEASFSKFHFIRLFRRINKSTPHQYLIKVRLDKARELMKSKLSISDICASVGFESPSSFSILFKENTGLSPTEFQSREHKLKNEMENKPLNFIPGCFAGAQHH